MSGGLRPRLLKPGEEDSLQFLFGGTQRLVHLRLNAAPPPREGCLLPNGHLQEDGMGHSLSRPDQPSPLNPGDRRVTDGAAGSPPCLILDP